MRAEDAGRMYYARRVDARRVVTAKGTVQVNGRRGANVRCTRSLSN